MAKQEVSGTVILSPLLFLEIGQEPARVEGITAPVVTHKCQDGLKKLSGKKRSSLLYSSVPVLSLNQECKLQTKKLYKIQDRIYSQRSVLSATCK